MAEQTAMLLAVVPELESGDVQTVAEPRTFPRRNVVIATGILSMTAAVAMWASGARGGVVQGRADAVVGFAAEDGDNDEDGDASVADALEAIATQDGDPDAFEQTFKVIDKDSNGEITAEELIRHMDFYGMDFPMKETNYMISKMDKGNGEIDFEEFRSHPQSGGVVEYEMRQLETFGAFDKDANGKVSAAEIRQALLGWNTTISQNYSNGIIDLGDKDDDDELDYGEFQDLLHSESFADTADDLGQIMAQNADSDQAHQQEFRKTFEIIDTDESGTITDMELGDWMKLLGEKPSDTELEGMVAQVDWDQDGVLNFEEFASHPRSEEGVMVEMQMLETFSAFDNNGNGNVNATEIGEALKGWGAEISQDDVKGIVDHADKDKDGGIDYQEFKKLMHSEEFTEKKAALAEILAQQEEGEQKQDEAFKTVFGVIDNDKDDSITGKELTMWYSHMGMGETPKFQVENDIAELDMGDGKLDLEEFSSHQIGQSLVWSEMEILKVFGAFDKNGDDKVTAEEMQAALAELGVLEGQSDKIIAFLKQHQEEKMDYEEFKTFMYSSNSDSEEIWAMVYAQQDEEWLKLDFDQIDENGDDSLTDNELHKYLGGMMGEADPEKVTEEVTRLISEVDKDNNGKVNFQEFKESQDDRGQSNEAEYEMQETEAEHEMQMQEFFGMVDTDQDEYVTSAELGPEIDPRFAEADKNGDEKLDYAEFKEAFDW